MIRYEFRSPLAAKLRALKDVLTYPARKAIADNVPTPELMKRRLLRDYLKRFSLRIFVETGTYLGETVAFMRPYCDRIYSIEIQKRLYIPAKERFKNDPKISILHGDSRKALRDLQLKEPALFWLDGHFKSGTTETEEVACPVPVELGIILSSPLPHVVLIDDAREFDGREYPSIESISGIAEAANRNCEVQSDIIRIY